MQVTNSKQELHLGAKLDSNTNQASRKFDTAIVSLHDVEVKTTRLAITDFTRNQEELLQEAKPIIITRVATLAIKLRFG